MICPNFSDHIWAQLPEGREDIHQGEGDGEGAQQDVRDGQVCDEDVPRSLQRLGQRCVCLINTV